RLANLRSLYLGGQYCGFTEVDLRPFANATRLLVFACDQSDLKGAEVVENFRELRSFAGFDFPMTSFASLQRATELRSLYAWGPGSDESGPRSLVPLAGLPRLERLTLLFTPIGELPANGFPSLRVLYLQGCGLPAAQQRAFRKAHPECKVDGAVDGEQLQATLAIADRVVLRTGGTCHRVVARERVLFETGDAAEIARLLPLLQVVEDGEGFHCGCCGGPTLVFSAAGREVASLGVHHGVALRWAEGPWNSDAALTREAAAGLEQWLVDHGDVATRRERDAARARAEAEERRASLRAAVFGEAVAPRADREELAADWLRRAAACKDDGLTQLRLLGCHEGAWDQQDEFDQALVTAATETLMATGDWSAVLAGGKADARCALGLAAVLVEQPVDPAAAERMAAAFVVAVPAALRSPQPWNRARMLQWLRDDPSPASLEWLLAALDGQFEPRQVQPVELVAPGGMVRIHPSDPVLDAAGSSTPVLAAMCLAVRRHVAALPRLRALLLAASPRDAKRLQAAIAQLEAVK
ncbi:MAG: hypothetical protein JNK15_24210, partial [Planctomycetes bacterium]|nr:hypothetical protein [Planctomycetota bacterium]